MPRSVAGVYSLYTPGNPVVPSTIITTTWANNTLSDLATAMTDSLSRSGHGGMTAPLQLAAGAIGLPGLTWTAETTSGFYRASAGNFRYAIGGADVLTITSTGISALNMTGSANPIASVGLTAVNGTATTFMRSDGAPALDQGIAPTWTGLHTHSNDIIPSTGIRNLGSAAARWTTTFTSSIQDGAVTENLLDSAGVTARIARGTSWTTLQFGNATANPAYTFLGTGAMSVAGTPTFSKVRVSSGDWGVYVASVDPWVGFSDTDGAANAKKWVLAAGANTFNGYVMNDAESALVNWLTVTRSAAAVTNVALGNATDNPSYTFLGTGAITTNGLNVRAAPRRTSGFVVGEVLATSGGVTINTSDLAAGLIFTIYNDSAAAITLTQGAGVTLRLHGGATTGNRTIAPRGLCTLWANSGTEVISTGDVT